MTKLGKNLARRNDLAHLSSALVRTLSRLAPLMLYAAAGASMLFGSKFSALHENFEFWPATLALLSLVITALAGFESERIARFLKRRAPAPRIFLSYSMHDRSEALELREDLERHGAKVWFAGTDLKIGDNWVDAVNSAIESSNAVVMFSSTSPSDSIKLELKAAMEKHVPVIKLTPDHQPVAPGDMKDSKTLNFQLLPDRSNIDALLKVARAAG